MRPEVEEIAEKIGSLPGLKTLAITTNGLVLAKKLPRLHAAGVNQLNISLDTFRSDRFTQMTRR